MFPRGKTMANSTVSTAVLHDAPLTRKRKDTKGVSAVRSIFGATVHIRLTSYSTIHSLRSMYIHVLCGSHMSFMTCQ
jgi:hypothetical protein